MRGSASILLRPVASLISAAAQISRALVSLAPFPMIFVFELLLVSPSKQFAFYYNLSPVQANEHLLSTS